MDQYKLLSDDMPIKENLCNIRIGILTDEFQPSTIEKISHVTVIRFEYEKAGYGTN